MWFWTKKKDNRIKLKFRKAKIGDSIKFSELHREYNKFASLLELPKSSDDYKKEIGKSIFAGDRYIVVEDDHNNMVGFIEVTESDNKLARLSVPVIDLKHPYIKENRLKVQMEMIKNLLKKMKYRGIKFVFTEFLNSDPTIQKIYKKLGFKYRKIVLQSWIGTINPDYNITIDPYNIRPIELQDTEVLYSWISRYLDMDSPLYVDYDNFKKMVKSQGNSNPGWVVLTLNNKPVCMITSFIDPNTNQLIVFGPFSRKGFEDTRLLILNELFIYFRMKGYFDVKIMRIRPIEDDEELFKKYNITLDEEVIIYSKKL